MTAAKRILIVDDNEVDILINRKCIELSPYSCDIISKQSAKSALEYLLAAAEEELPDVLFLDIKMPEMDGFEFLDRLFSSLPHKVQMKVVILTSSTAPEDVSKARALAERGVIDYVEKPLTTKLDYLREILHSN